MKIKILLVGLLLSLMTSAQIRKGESAYTVVNFATDPWASIKEEGPNLSIELERVQNFGYIKTGLEVFPVLEGGYNYLYAAFGFNLKVGHFDNWRLYSGIKAGPVYRANNLYVNYGFEAGINYVFDSGLILGLKTDAIYRDDFMSWGGDPIFRGSGYLLIAFKL